MHNFLICEFLNFLCLIHAVVMLIFMCINFEIHGFSKNHSFTEKETLTFCGYVWICFDLQWTSHLISQLNSKIHENSIQRMLTPLESVFTIPRLSQQIGVRSVLLPVRLQNWIPWTSNTPTCHPHSVNTSDLLYRFHIVANPLLVTFPIDIGFW